MPVRGVRMVQLVTLLAVLVSGCTPRSEDTSCPAMQQAIDEAGHQGLLEPLPLTADGGTYKVVLENRGVDRSCDVIYRFRISGVTARDYESDAYRELICGPVPIVGSGFGMDEDDLLMEARVSQWQPTTEMRLVVGGQDCSGVPLTFTHVGRIAQP